jgi:hypothetical protein
MGAGILPMTLIGNKVYFLFGKENKFETSAPGFADFGGGSEKNETYLNTALREGSEELTGFLGDERQLAKLLKKYGYKTLELKQSESIYKSFAFPIEYDSQLTFYYNNNQRFIQQKLDDEVIKNTRIFEKSEIKWFCIDDLKKVKINVQFRYFYKEMLDIILENKSELINHVKKSLSKKRNKTFKKNN